MKNNSLDQLTLKVEGMSCGHCKATVTNALQALQGVASVEVDLQGGTAVLTGTDLDQEAAIQAVVSEGYRAQAL